MSAKIKKVRVRIVGFDSKVVDKSAKMILQSAYNTGSQVMGPVFLPNKRSTYCVLSAPTNKKRSMEHFEKVVHVRLVDVFEPTVQTVDALQHLELPAGVDITVKSILESKV